VASAGGQSDLAVIRQVTARFHDVEVAKAAGYELGYMNGAKQQIITGCIANPAAGVMGYHFFKKSLIDDNVIDVEKPEGLVYTLQDGEYKLGAIEYVVPGANSNPPGPATAPSVLGIQMHIINPVVGFWTQHFWVWSHNPAGIFVDWNPSLSCP
jgi:hypothetical protein